MRFDPSDLNIVDDLRSVLDELSVVGQRRHMIFELFFVQHLREWERPCDEGYFSGLLDVPDGELRELLQAMANEDLVVCAQDMKSGCISGIDLSDEFVARLSKRQEARRTAAREYRDSYRTPRPASDAVKLRAHLLFDGTCELCGEKAVQGKDQRGNRMVAARVKKELDGTAENITLLCSGCNRENRGRDLPDDCRTVRMLDIAQERGYEQTPRTAVAPPKPIKEIVVTASGPISVKTRNLESAPEVRVDMPRGDRP